ncbi:unnamed protein product, partial [Ectocarpus sp. 13 AM-2016]
TCRESQQVHYFDSFAPPRADRPSSLFVFRFTPSVYGQPKNGSQSESVGRV